MRVSVYHANRLGAPSHQPGGLVVATDGRRIFAFPAGMASWNSAHSVRPGFRIAVENAWGLQLLQAYDMACPYMGKPPKEGRLRVGYHFSVRGRRKPLTVLDCGACGYHETTSGRYATHHPSDYKVILAELPHAELTEGVGFDSRYRNCWLVPSSQAGELAIVRFRGEVRIDYLERHFDFDSWCSFGKVAVISSARLLANTSV